MESEEGAQLRQGHLRVSCTAEIRFQPLQFSSKELFKGIRALPWNWLAPARGRQFHSSCGQTACRNVQKLRG